MGHIGYVEKWLGVFRIERINLVLKRRFLRRARKFNYRKRNKNGKMGENHTNPSHLRQQFC